MLSCCFGSGSSKASGEDAGVRASSDGGAVAGEKGKGEGNEREKEHLKSKPRAIDALKLCLCRRASPLHWLFSRYSNEN